MQTDAPLVLTKQGSFFVGGSNITGSPTADYTVNQMYVEYQVPLHKKCGAYPIIMVPGSSHTGKTYDETPDGREGWKTYFLRHGYAVYVVDQAGRARSSFNASAIRRAKEANDAARVPQIGGFSDGGAWTNFRIGPTPYTPYPDSQFPVEAKEQYFAQLVPNTESTLEEGHNHTLIDLALLLDKIGPSIIMAHSQSGKLGWRVAAKKFPLVKAVIAIEPSGGCEPADVKIASILKFVPSLVVLGDHPEGNAPFTEPIISTCTAFMQKVNAAGGHGTFLQTPQAGFHGNSHMLMLEKNNLKIADWIIDWLDHNVPISTD